jgi:hypothetical protein
MRVGFWLGLKEGEILGSSEVGNTVGIQLGAKDGREVFMRVGLLVPVGCSIGEIVGDLKIVGLIDSE